MSWSSAFQAVSQVAVQAAELLLFIVCKEGELTVRCRAPVHVSSLLNSHYQLEAEVFLEERLSQYSFDFLLSCLRPAIID